MLVFILVKEKCFDSEARFPTSARKAQNGLAQKSGQKYDEAHFNCESHSDFPINPCSLSLLIEALSKSYNLQYFFVIIMLGICAHFNKFGHLNSNPLKWG